jgi:ribosomal protein S21
MVEAKRKRGETFDSMLRRFNKKIQQSGKMLQAKKIRFQAERKSRSEKRKNVLRRIQIRENKEYLKKIGRLKEEETQEYRRR